MFTENELSVLHETRKRFVRNLLRKIGSKDKIEHYSSRVKEEKSVKAKLKKKGLERTAANAAAFLSDLIGVRIVVHFVGDVYDIAEKIRSSCEVREEIDYIASPKDTGYRSFHMVVDVPVSDPDAFPYGKKMPVEIQIRTVAMDCWASLEHQMLYKKDDVPQSSLVRNELMRCAETLFSTDMEMEALQNIIKKS